MAIAEVGSGSQRATGSGNGTLTATAAFPANVTAGNLLVVAGAVWTNPAITSCAVTDTRSTSYTVLLAPTGVTWGGGVGKEFIAYGIAPSSGACTVTVDPSGGTAYINVAIDEFSGVHATPLDVDGGESTGTSTAPSDALTTLTAGALIIGSACSDNPIGWTAGSGYTLIGSTASTAIQPYAVEFQIVGAAGAQVANFAITSAQWSVYSAAFKVPVAAITGASATPLGGLTMASAGVVGTVANVLGSSATTLGPLTSLAIGELILEGLALNSLGALTSVAAGTVAAGTGITGTAARALGGLTMAATGTTGGTVIPPGASPFLTAAELLMLLAGRHTDRDPGWTIYPVPRPVEDAVARIDGPDPGPWPYGEPFWEERA